MLFWALFVLGTSLAGVVYTQEANPCCLPMQYQGFMTEHAIEGDMFFADHELGQITVNYTEGKSPDSVDMAYFDYNTKNAYFMHHNGTCTSKTTIKGMRKPCEYEGGRIGNFDLGLDFRQNRLAFANLEQLKNGTKQFQQYDVWDFSCGLLHSSTYAYEPATGKFGFYVMSYANMNADPADPAVFDIPPECLAA